MSQLFHTSFKREKQEFDASNWKCQKWSSWSSASFRSRDQRKGHPYIYAIKLFPSAREWNNHIRKGNESNVDCLLSTYNWFSYALHRQDIWAPWDPCRLRVFCAPQSAIKHWAGSRRQKIQPWHLVFCSHKKTYPSFVVRCYRLEHMPTSSAVPFSFLPWYKVVFEKGNVQEGTGLSGSYFYQDRKANETQEF